MVRKTKIKLLIFLIIILFSACNKKETYDIPETKLFQDQPELIVNDSGFSIKFINRDSSSIWLHRYRFDDIGRIIRRYWFRYYTGNSIFEMRFYKLIENLDYIIVINNDNMAFYIKWRTRQYSSSKEHYYSSDIGKNTIYLETSLSSQTIRKYFPEIKCNIIEKHPNAISFTTGANNSLNDPANGFLGNQYNVEFK